MAADAEIDERHGAERGPLRVAALQQTSTHTERERERARERKGRWGVAKLELSALSERRARPPAPNSASSRAGRLCMAGVSDPGSLSVSSPPISSAQSHPLGSPRSSSPPLAPASPAHLAFAFPLQLASYLDGRVCAKRLGAVFGLARGGACEKQCQLAGVVGWIWTQSGGWEKKEREAAEGRSGDHTRLARATSERAEATAARLRCLHLLARLRPCSADKGLRRESRRCGRGKWRPRSTDT